MHNGDSVIQICCRFNNWINSGTKGEDFVRNLAIPEFDFYGIHVVRQHTAPIRIRCHANRSQTCCRLPQL